MSRLPAAAFAALVVATVGAFFVTQHLKVTTPFYGGASFTPQAINPVSGATCGGVSHRFTKISFYLLHRTDDVDVEIVDASGNIVRTLATGRHMPRGVTRTFTWQGREDNGAFAPDGDYYVKIDLIQQGRSIEISNAAGPVPITIVTVPPRPVVTSVKPALIPQGSKNVTIQYTGNGQRSGQILLYRTDLPGPPRLVSSFLTQWAHHSVVWNGVIDRRPAPPGVYLIGFAVADAACNTGRFPALIPPFAGSTPNAGVTVRYLAAEPPLDPVAARSRTTVYVDARHHRYHWVLWRPGTRKPAAEGVSGGFALALRPPAVGMYVLALNAGAHTTDVPLVVSAVPAPRPRRILVVVPALTWQGLNPVDDDHDGMPDTLAAAHSIALDRPLEHGLPADVADEESLLEYLDHLHVPYDLTTDLGLIDGAGPGLAGHRSVILAGSERWVPSALAAALRSYVADGGHLLSLGIDSLRRSVTVRDRRASGATGPAATDIFGARLGSLASQRASDVISVIQDGLGLFSGTAGAIQGFTSYQPVASVSAPARLVSAAGATSGAPSIAGLRLGAGVVVEVGLPGFATSLAGNVNAQEVFGRMLAVLGR